MAEAQSTDKVSESEKGVAEPQAAIILYADLLGFSKNVCDAKDSGDVPCILDRLDLFAREFFSIDYEDEETRNSFSKKFWAFSDSIVICWYGGSLAQAMMNEFDADLDQLSGIAAAQARILLEYNQPVRGGVGKGWFIERDKTVAGTALVRAAKIEKIISAPFIGVEEELYAHYAVHPGRANYSKSYDPFPTLFIPPCNYTNSIPALDYFMVGLGEIDLTGAQMLQARSISSPEEKDSFRNVCWLSNREQYVNLHKQRVKDGMNNPDQKVQAKYDALRQHHNFRVSGLYPDRSDLLVL